MLIVTEQMMLYKGLKCVGFNQECQACVNCITNLERFCSWYGSNPIVYIRILHDLQTTNVPEARINSNEYCLKHFFMAIHWLKSYRNEDQQSGLFGFCNTTCRKYSWFFAEKIQALAAQKVSRKRQH
jgi:hypothetical protein